MKPFMQAAQGLAESAAEVLEAVSKLVPHIEKVSSLFDETMGRVTPLVQKVRAEVKSSFLHRAEIMRTLRESGMSEEYAWKVYQAYYEEEVISDKVFEMFSGVASSLIPMLMKKAPPSREEMLRFVSDEARSMTDAEFEIMVQEVRAMRAQQHAAEHCHEGGCAPSEPTP